jgi:Acyl-CoA dehydrogenase, C-terminal domain
MNLSLPDGSAAFAETARRAMADAGGTELFRRAEADAGVRDAVVRPLLDRLGVFDLDPRSDLEAAVAAAELCRVAGACCLPFPVAALLGRPPSGDWDFAALVVGPTPWIEHADLPGRWLAVTEQGDGRPADAVRVTRNLTMAPFAQRVRLGEVVTEVARSDQALLMNLESARVLGAVETAHHLAIVHVQGREQFGKPLAALQAVQFHVADCEIALRGLRQLTRYTTWRLEAAPGSAWPDALALRTFALETARTVLSTAELLHGATGFCDEHDLTVVSRSVQGPARLPADLESTTAALAAAIDAEGFDSVFSGTPGAARARATTG